MRTVVVESPYGSRDPIEVLINEAYLMLCLQDCLARGEAPFASHALYTRPGVLRDQDIEERRLGMQAGFAIGAKLEATIVYTDLGLTDGMAKGVAHAHSAGRVVEKRSLYVWTTLLMCKLLAGEDNEDHDLSLRFALGNLSHASRVRLIKALDATQG